MPRQHGLYKASWFERKLIKTHWLINSFIQSTCLLSAMCLHSQVISAHLDMVESDKRSSLPLEKELAEGEKAVKLKNSVNKAECGLGPNAGLRMQPSSPWEVGRWEGWSWAPPLRNKLAAQKMVGPLQQTICSQRGSTWGSDSVRPDWWCPEVLARFISTWFCRH